MLSKSEKLSTSEKQAQSIRRQQKGTFVGTTDFLSPEMVGDFSISGPFTDLWALGIICFQLYAGRSPWVGNQNDQILDEIAVAANILFPDSMPKPCVGLIKILLEKNPARRMGLTK